MTYDASVVPAGDRWTLIFIRELSQPPERVWVALTDPRSLDRWAPFAASDDLGKTGPVVLTMVDGDTRVPMAGEVLRAEEPRLLEYRWGDDILRWELDISGGGTRLTLRHTMTEPSMVAAGWHICSDVLQRLLDGEPVEAVRGQAAMAHGWESLRDAYADRFRQ